MPYLTLTLSGFPVDLPPDAAVALSYRVNDLRTLDSREAAFSETFTLPLTAQNVAVLGSPHSLDSGTTTPYRLLPAVLTSPGGVELLVGFAILELAHQGYDVTLTNALGGLFTMIGERKLSDLNLSAYDHPYTYASVFNADLNDYRGGYTYAWADDGRLTKRDPDVGILFYETVLSTFYHTVLRAIVAEALVSYGPAGGVLSRYALTGSLLAESTYRRAVLPRATAYPQLRASVVAGASASGLFPAARPYQGPNNGQGAGVFALQFTQTIDPRGNFFAGTYFTPPVYAADVSVKVSLRVQLVQAKDYPGGQNAVAEINLRNASGDNLGPGVGYGGLYATKRLFGGAARDIPAQPVAVEFTADLSWLQPDGPGIAQRLALFLSVGGLVATVLPGSSVSFEVGPRLYPGGPVALEAALPDLSQADFLKLVVNQFNVIVQADPVLQTVRFDLFNDLEKNRARAVDWSAKVDWAQGPRLAFRLGEYAQQNTLAYKEAPEAYGALPAEAGPPAALTVTNATLPARAEAYAAPAVLPRPHAALTGAAQLLWLPFLAEPTDLLYPIGRWRADLGYGTESQPVVYAGQAWQATANTPANQPPHLLPPDKWKRVAYTVLNESLPTCALLAPATAIAPPVRDEAPGTGAYMARSQLSRTGFDWPALLSAYYPGLQALLYRVQVLTLDVRLSALDVAGLDFTVPVRLTVPAVAGYGTLDCLGYLNLIDQFQPGTPGAVAVTLVVLGEPVPGLAPAVPNPTPTPRRALADQLAQLLLTEDSGYIFLEA